MTSIDISSLPAFFKNIDEGVLIQPVLHSAEGTRGGFHLTLEGWTHPVTVTEFGHPLWCGGVRDILPLLMEGYLLEKITDEARVDIRGCF